MALSVSIIIPTYNRARLVRRAIRSAAQQVGPSDEIIVVDDGSTDGTRRAIASFGDRVRYLRTAHRGAGHARNAAVAEAKGDLIAFLDSDDEWMPGKLDLARRWLEARPDALFVFSDFSISDRFGVPEHRFLIHWHGDFRPWSEILGPGRPYSADTPLPARVPDFLVHTGDLYPLECQRAYVFTSTFVVRRREAGNAIHFCEQVPTMEDLECFGRVARAGHGAFFDIETAWQHDHDGTRLSALDVLRRTSAHLTILETVWGSDRDYLSGHRSEYLAVADEVRRQRARALLVHGRIREARTELLRMHHPPLGERLLSHVPAAVVMGLTSIRRHLRAS